MQYTPDQQKAIQDHPAGNVLVSASAGSGKTRVLVDRIIEMVKNQGVNIDQLLVVTFTNAAAKEMRERLRKSLQSEFAKANDAETKKHLLTQIRKVAVADITTMDAYCQKLVGRYYYILGIDPNFRVLSDSTEIQLLKEQVWDNVREDLYGQDVDHSFAELTENFSNDRSDDGLTNVIFQMDDFANVNENPDDWLAKTATFYDIGDGGLIKSDLYQRLIKPEIDATFKRLVMSHQAIIQLAQQAELPKVEALFTDQLATIQRLAEQMNQADSWDDLRTLLTGFSFASMNKARLRKDTDDYQKQLYEQVKTTNKKMKADWAKLLDHYFTWNEQDNLTLMAAAKSRVEKLVTVVKTFRLAYKQAKARRHLMQFIDIEHAAYDILNDQSDQAKQVRQRLQTQYVEIMTDEYQDNNRLQDAILNRIARPDRGNRFMVGDVKQSIYRFRLADPTMFIKKQTQYRQADTADELINLSENFRSAKNIDAFTNLIFEQTMDTQVGNIDYSGKAKLQFGATYYPENLNADVSLVIYRTKSSTAATTDEDVAADQIEDSDSGQAEIIAQKIRALVTGQQLIYDKQTDQMRPVTYGDIAVISPTHNNELTLSDIFSRYNIPAEITGAKSYFKTTEIQIMMALLSIIDNPFQDIPLVAVLRSPIVGLDENQLAYLRINRNTGNYYQAVLAFYQRFSTDEPNDYATQIYQRIDRFMKQLRRFKDIAQQDGLVALIWDIYNQTGYLDYVGGMPAGLQRQTNLHALYDRAADYEKNGFKGLFQFVQFIQRMQDRDNDLANTNPTTSDNTVHVMTIHGSKGLQFPIVFLNDVGKQFNMQDTMGKYVLNDHWGIGISYFNNQSREFRSPLQRQAILDMTKNAGLAEEMRKLYVAMTRAEQRLYLIAKIKGDKSGDNQQLIQHWQQQTDANQLVLPAAVRSAAKNYLDWIGPAISRHPRVTEEVGDSVGSPVLATAPADFRLDFYDDERITKEAGGQVDKPVSPNEFIDRLTKKPTVVEQPTKTYISRVMNLDYPHQAATVTTAYQSVSEIKRLFDDPDNTQLSGYSMLDVNKAANTGRYLKADLEVPEFISAGTGQPAPTEIGTATHLVLQQLDLSTPPTADSVTALITNLTQQHILEPAVAAKINVDEVLQFYQSDVGRLVLANPEKTHREAPFSLLMKAKDVFKGFQDNDDQTILIHGIIDGYVVTADEVSLFDYKTDRLTPKTTVADIVKRYRGQLALYALALSKILHRPVTHQYLYLLAANQAVELSHVGND
ncbi:helicase-exonuclease AddAB subunit AddA [Lentilactobacillus raoultii]|uniref:ATP-dependent helicase/nuclease subunit A n=1 Tax=Lentilactobacillus raoultii TaxID=1987503 RepID=A0ABW3PN82_9LACO|nr:helicase-exonuclease AddAB subunit AddA [Lentilactobacillus raoultii]